MRPSITRKPVPTKPASQEPVAVADSGYYGSQTQEVTFQSDELAEKAEPIRQPLTALAEPDAIDALGPTTEVFEDPPEPVKVAEINHTRAASPEAPVDQEVEAEPEPASSPVNLLGPEPSAEPPVEASPTKSSPVQPEVPAADEGGQEHLEGTAVEPALGSTAEDDEVADVTGSPSDGSSPIRPLVRKSSLNFASLPAREPMASNKSLGPRVSRLSHIDQARTSFYPRITGGKSLGIRQETRGDDYEAMDIDEDEIAGPSKESTFAAHSKTYTQRLQDQISMLGKSQAGGARLSKSIPSLVGTQKAVPNNQSQISQATRTDTEMDQTPPRKQQVAKTPGAFPEDDEDDWIAPPTTVQAATQSPRPAIEKSYTADVMEGLHGKDTVGGAEFVLPQHPSQSGASQSPPEPPASKPDLAPPIVAHIKSASVDLSRHNHPPQVSESSLRKIVSASNPVSVTTQDNDIDEPPKSPSRTFRESPLKHSALKQVKNKFSSILKNSKGLLASSAAISAEGKASLVNSPSTVRLGKQPTKSTDSLRPGNEPEPLYPDLTRHASWDSQPAPTPSSPSKPNGRRTRASAERDRREQKQKGREDKEAAHIANQMDKLEKEREKEREKARVFSKEQERIAAAEKQLAAQRERERATRTPAPKDGPRPTRSSPRKAKTQQEPDPRAAAELAESELADRDVEMTDAPPSKAAPASIPRPTPVSTLKNRETKRPTKPTREPVTKLKQAPTLIRVNTSSQNSGFHPSNSVLAATLENTLGPSQQQIKGKTSQPTLQSKTSQQSFNSSVNSTTGRPKALDLAAKRKQQEEKEAQRRRDAKAEIDRKRAAMREEERRQEQERREKERQQAAKEEEAKKKAQRQAAIEKAKQTRAPPPAVRSQPNAAPDYNSVRDKAGLPRPPSRLQHSAAHRSQEDISRPVNAVLSSTTSMSLKRPLQHDGTEDGAQRPTASRSGPSQPKEVKRMRMSDEFDLEDEAEIQSYGTSLKGPPVRPSAGFKKVSC